MLKKTLYVGLPLLAVLLIIYYYLGGFNQTQISIAETEDYVIAGYSYRGPYREEELQQLFFRAKDFVETGTLEGTIAVLNYDDEFAAGDSIRQLIGVRLASAPMQKPADIQMDTIPAGKVVRAIIKAHPLVMPHPQDTQKKIINFAQEQSLSLEDMSVEQYVGETEIWVEVPLK